MISHRTRYSLAQFLSIQEASASIALFSKYGVEHLSLYPSQLLTGIMNIVRDQDDRTLLLVLQEIVATPGLSHLLVVPPILSGTISPGFLMVHWVVFCHKHSNW